MASNTTRLRHVLARGLGIKLQDREPYQKLAESHSATSIPKSDRFYEEAPTTAEYLESIIPNRKELTAYLFSLFPFLSWIGHYNLQWLAGDLVAGITIGAVVVPQSMSYATLAGLPVQFGLYSSFMGVLIYWFFATSKDITIGPVAVMSQLTGTIVADVGEKLPNLQAHEIASAVAILAGSIVFFIGLIRCGWVVDLLPLSALLSFMTGSAINIAVGQLGGLFGISSYYPKLEPPYRLFIDFLRTLPKTTLDAAVGVTALFLLYLIRWSCNQAAKRWPSRQRPIFFVSTLRTAFVILLYTFIGWLVNRGLDSKSYKFKMLQKVPIGFENAAVPTINKELASHLVSYLPSTVIVLLIEHIAISKSFGRLNNYKINPSQEMVAIGVTNLLGPFLGGYAATGSFSRTAIKSKAGVRTPFAGVITAVVVLLALYCLTALFFYIPNAALSAVIIHAVCDLITPPQVLYKFWLVNPIEVFIFMVGVMVTVFTNIENGVYCTISLSAGVLIYRILRQRGRFLGLVKIRSVMGDRILGLDAREEGEHSEQLHQQPQDSTTQLGVIDEYGTFKDVVTPRVRNMFLPIDHEDGSNPHLLPTTLYPGIFIYRFSEGFTYPNASYNLEHLTQHIMERTRRTNLTHFARPGDRPWNDPGPSRRERKAAERAGKSVAAVGQDPNLPTLKAIILDFSTVNNVDVTSVQALIDVRNQLDRYTAPDVVDWHFAHVGNRWTKRALVSAGFGYPTERPDGLHHRWRGIFSVAEIGGDQSAAASAELAINKKELGPAVVLRAEQMCKEDNGNDIEACGGVRSVDENPKATMASSETAHSAEDGEPNGTPRGRRSVPVHGINRPLFHIDLTSALQSAIANIEARREVASTVQI